MQGVLGASIQIGDEVYAYNEATSEISRYPVIATYRAERLQIGCVTGAEL